MTFSTRLLAVMLVLVFSHRSLAAYSSSSGTAIGLLGGYRINNLAQPNETSGNRAYKNTPAYQVGLVLLFPMNESVSVRLGATYALKDMEFSSPINGPVNNGKARLTYIDLPATLQISLSSSFYLNVGQLIGVKVGDTCDLNNGTSNCSAIGTLPAFNIVSIFGLGWNVFDLGSSGKFSIEATYEYGLNNILSAYNTNTTGIVANGMFKFNL